MTLLTNGDFDQVIEIGRTLFTDTARSTMAIRTPPSPVNTADFSAFVSAAARLAEIWFRERPGGWAQSSGFGALSRTTRDMVTLALEVDVQIDLRELVIELAGQVARVDLTADPAYAVLRKVEFRAWVEIHDHLEIQSLQVRTSREDPTASVRIPCVVIDFNQSLGFPANWPRIELRLRESDLLAAKAVQLMMTAARIRNGSGADASALAELVGSLTEQIRESITGTLSALHDWRITDVGKSIVHADTSEQPRPIKALEARTLDDSLVICIDYLAKRGTISNVAASTLDIQSARLDDLGITINNRMLLRGIIRPALIAKFGLPAMGGMSASGLSPSDFMTSEYCELNGPVEGNRFSESATGTQTGTINSLVALVNDKSETQILLTISTDIAPGITAHATLDLRLAFAVTRLVNGPHQVLRVIPTLVNPTTAVVSKQVDVAWWIYLGAAALAGIYALIAVELVAIFDGIVAEIIANGQLADTVSKIQLPGTDSSVPLPVELIVPRARLNDAGAPVMPTARGSVLGTMFKAAAHDLYVGARYNRLPDTMTVTFQIPDSADAGSRLDGLGGVLADGSTEWALDIDDAIAQVDAGRRLLVSVPPAPPVAVIAAVTADGIPYLRTVSDDFGMNNLGNLPKRLPAILGPLG